MLHISFKIKAESISTFGTNGLKPRTVIVKTDYGKFSVEGPKQSIDS